MMNRFTLECNDDIESNIVVWGMSHGVSSDVAVKTTNLTKDQF